MYCRNIKKGKSCVRLTLPNQCCIGKFEVLAALLLKIKIFCDVIQFEL